MGILDFLKQHKTYNIKDINELPDEYKHIIYNLRPAHTLLGFEAFLNLYTAILIDNNLYLLDTSKADNYTNSHAKIEQMVDFIYTTEKQLVLKNRFGDYNKYTVNMNCKDYKIRKNNFCCIQWTGKNLQEVFDFCGGSWYFINKFFDGEWDKFAEYVKTHNHIFKVWYSDNYHRCAYPGDYLLRFVDGNILIVSRDVFEDNFKEKA